MNSATADIASSAVWNRRSSSTPSIPPALRRCQTWYCRSQVPLCSAVGGVVIDVATRRAAQLGFFLSKMLLFLFCAPHRHTAAARYYATGQGRRALSATPWHVPLAVDRGA